MFEFKNNHRITSKYYELPDLTKRNSGLNGGFFNHEEKYVDTDTSDEVINVNYSQTDADDDQVNYIEARKKRNKILRLSDIWELPSSKNSSGNLYTDTQKTAIVTYKDTLRDLPNTIISNGFTDLSFPTYPTSIPQRDKDKIDFILSDYNV